jgi:hypothetical protein
MSKRPTDSNRSYWKYLTHRWIISSAKGLATIWTAGDVYCIGGMAGPSLQPEPLANDEALVDPMLAAKARGGNSGL